MRVPSLPGGRLGPRPAPDGCRRAAPVSAYDGLAARWDHATAVVYEPLARALVDSSPVPLAGRLVLDIGGGTGAVAKAAAAAGATVVTADRSLDMARVAGMRWPSVRTDALALPFRDDSCFAVLAGFLLNHAAPGAALNELARVAAPGGVVLASTWAGGDTDPVKAAIDGVLRRWGWVPPAWYTELKASIEPVSGDAARLARAATAAGLVDVRATVSPVETAVTCREAAVAYRLAMPQMADWIADLSSAVLDALRNEAVAALGWFRGTWRPMTIVLAARVPPTSVRPADPHGAPASSHTVQRPEAGRRPVARPEPATPRRRRRVPRRP